MDFFILGLLAASSAPLFIKSNGAPPPIEMVVETQSASPYLISNQWKFSPLDPEVFEWSKLSTETALIRAIRVNEWSEPRNRNYTYQVKFLANTIMLLNLSADTTEIKLCGGHPLVWQEAQDAQGAWARIETPPDCLPDSVERVRFKPNHYYRIIGPKYGGILKTKIRVCTVVGKDTIRTQEFFGKISKEQFSR